MKVCFVLPKFSRKPIGGFKIVFEYANRLSQKGHKVAILFLKKKLSSFLTKIEPRWFKLDSSIKKYQEQEQTCKKKSKMSM